MSRYSTYLNEHVKENNDLDVINSGANSFTGGAGSSNISQTAFTNVTLSGIKTVTHSADADGKRLVQVAELIPGDSGVSNTALDFDLVDADQFIQQTTSGIDFNGLAKLHDSSPILAASEVELDSSYKYSALTLSSVKSYVDKATGGAGGWGGVIGKYELSGKKYFEIRSDTGGYLCVGIASRSCNFASTTFYNETQSYVYQTATNGFWRGNAAEPYGVSWAEADAVIGVAYDSTAGTLEYFKNGVSQGVLSSLPTSGMYPCLVVYPGYTMEFYAREQDFVYSIPSGYSDLASSPSYTASTLATTEPTFLMPMELDASSNNIELTHYGAVRYEPISPLGSYAMAFKTNTDYLLTDSMFNVGTGAFTIEYWIKPHVTDADDYVFVLSGAPHLQIYHGATGQIWIWTQTDSSKSISVPYMRLDSWNHVAIVRASTTDFKVFVNGVLALNSTLYADYSSTYPIYLGRSSAASGSIEGWMSEIRISDVARYSASFTPSTTAFTNDGNTLLLIHAAESDGSTTFTDSSSNNVTLTPGGNAKHEALTPAIGNTGIIDFTNTANNYIEATLTSAFALGTSSDFTVEGWVYFDGFNGTYQSIFYNWAGGAFTYYDDANQRFAVYYNGGSGFFFSDNYVLAVDTWYHIAITRQSGTIKFFVDGDQDSHTASDSSNVLGSGTIRFGQGSSSTYQLKGRMAEIRYSNNARYTGNFTPSTTSFSDDANTLLLLHGDTLHNLEMTSVVGPQLKSTTGKFDQGFYFDGSSSYINVDPSPDFKFGGDNFTIDFWATVPAGTASERGIAAAWNDGAAGNRMWGIVVTPATSMGMYQSTGGSSNNNYVSATINTVWTYDEWHHYAYVRDGNLVRFFFDGVQMGTGDCTGIVLYDGNSPLRLGNPAGFGSPFKGTIDEFKITKGTAVWTSNFSPPAVAYSAATASGTDASTYITTSDYNHITLSGSISTINSVTIDETIPSNTYLRGLVSFDGRNTWKKYDGGWTTVSGMNFTGATISGLEAGLTDYSVTNESYLDFAFDFETYDSSASPSIDLVTVNYDEFGNYRAAKYSDYKIEVLSSTSTRVTKLSSGTKNIKVNVLI